MFANKTIAEMDHEDAIYFEWSARRGQFVGKKYRPNHHVWATFLILGMFLLAGMTLVSMSTSQETQDREMYQYASTHDIYGANKGSPTPLDADAGTVKP